MKKRLLLLATTLCILSTQAQDFGCGTDEIQQQLFLSRPDLHPGIVRADAALKAFTENYVPTKSNALYIIPVVFHVIHNNGPENISNAQIHDALKQLNLQYRKLNPDTSEIVAAFQGIAADVQIEFRLAQLDPNGNCTSGITRTQSTLTYIGDHQVKDLVHWPREKYLNVYVCYDAAGLAGHALMPAVADTIPEWDGIVMRHDYVGTIGTSDYFRRTVLSHEVGHYLNLFHIWGGNNVPNFYYLPVGDAGNCAFDDDVTDTPNTIGWSSCNLSANSCSSLDNVQNYMDYAYCARMFTEGQKTRMHAALNAPIAGRNNLWQPANLVATGTDGSTLLCAASMRSSRRVACTGQSFWIHDESYHGVTSRTWNLNGGTLLTNAGDSIEVSFANAGVYSIGLEVSNGATTVDTLFQNYITILPNTGTFPGLSEDFESNLSNIQQQWVFPYVQTAGTWELAGTGYMSPQALYLNNFVNPSPQVFTLDTKPLDFSGMSNLAISFDWAYAQRTPNNADLFQLQISTDCGVSWSTRKTYVGLSTLKSVQDTLAIPFSPQNAAQWAHDTVFINVASLLTDHSRLRFRYESKGGNNFYLDNIRVGALASLNLEEAVGTSEWSFSPNPAHEEIQIAWNEYQHVERIAICDLAGNLLETYPVLPEVSERTISVKGLRAGMYFIQVWINGKQTCKKLLVN